MTPKEKSVKELIKKIDFREKIIKMHEEDNNKHALQWFINDIIEEHKIELQEQAKQIFDDIPCPQSSGKNILQCDCLWCESIKKEHMK